MILMISVLSLPDFFDRNSLTAILEQDLTNQKIIPLKKMTINATIVSIMMEILIRGMLVSIILYWFDIAKI